MFQTAEQNTSLQGAFLTKNSIPEDIITIPDDSVPTSSDFKKAVDDCIQKDEAIYTRFVDLVLRSMESKYNYFHAFPCRQKKSINDESGVPILDELDMCVPLSARIIAIPIIHSGHYSAIMVHLERKEILYVNSRASPGDDKPTEYEGFINIVKDKFFGQHQSVKIGSIFRNAVQTKRYTCGLWVIATSYSTVTEANPPTTEDDVQDLLDEVIQDTLNPYLSEPISVSSSPLPEDNLDNISDLPHPKINFLTDAEMAKLKNASALVEHIYIQQDKSKYFVESPPRLDIYNDPQFYVVKIRENDKILLTHFPNGIGQGSSPSFFYINEKTKKPVIARKIPNTKPPRFFVTIDKIPWEYSEEALLKMNRKYCHHVKENPNIELTITLIEGSDYYGISIKKSV